MRRREVCVFEERELWKEKTYRERGLRTVVCRSRREAWKGKGKLGVVLERRGLSEVCLERIDSWEMCFGRRAL